MTSTPITIQKRKQDSTTLGFENLIGFGAKGLYICVGFGDNLLVGIGNQFLNDSSTKFNTFKVHKSICFAHEHKTLHLCKIWAQNFGWN
jgi:hypothetical protein